MTSRRSKAWIAVFISLVLHLLGISFVYERLFKEGGRSRAMPDAMAVRILNMPQLKPAGLPKRTLEASPKSTNPSGRRGSSAGRVKEVAELMPERAGETLTQAASGPTVAASLPSTPALLSRLTEGVLATDRAKEPVTASSKPWLSKVQSGRPEMNVEHSSAFGRVERVQSSSGVYCIRVPNAAGAYRNSSGFNLAVATNCP